MFPQLLTPILARIDPKRVSDSAMAISMTNAGTTPQGVPFYRRYWVCWFAFYLLMPMLLAMHLGAGESGSATFVAKRYYFLYFLAACLPNWWAMEIATRLVHRILRPWGPPLVVVLVLGVILAMNVSGTWAPLRHSLFEPYLAEGSRFYSIFPWRYHEADYLMQAVVAWTSASVTWVAANYFFLKVLNFPRFGYGVSESPKDLDLEPKSEPNAAPAIVIAATAQTQHILLDQLPEKLGRTIIALKAEEHYTRVFTDKGEALILMRFRDALALLDDLGGVQTHRSYWVNSDYVEEVLRNGRSSTVRLTTGLEIPVSRSYRVMVHKALGSSAAD